MHLTDIFPDLSPLQTALLDWFARSQRELPWRRDYTPYKVWISEIMLQQTQMDRGVAYFENWMRLFPDLPSLAGASEETVLRAWEGLGYYSRARNLLKAARMVMKDHGGVFPSRAEDIVSLPGVGPYTAAAIASIAFQQDIACVDANVERVLSRLADLAVPVRQNPGKALLADMAGDFLTRGHAREHNQAMMELGALVCGRKPDCPSCPLSSFCLARKRGTVSERPVLPARQKRIPITVSCGLLLHESRVYVQRRLPNDVWGGMWEFPGGGREGEERPDETVVREFLEETGFAVRVAKNLIVLRTNYTKYDITMHFFVLDFADAALRAAPLKSLPEPALSEADACRWVTLEELEELPMPSLHRKLAQSLRPGGNTLFTSLNDEGGPLAALLARQDNA
ncbi:MAG: A/G-specific adenine glycosylase [Desulfovibrionaceae bacterium]|nr:A/G-specific adenine glycosylase [Desulfovibrionaceae bacterium]